MCEPVLGGSETGNPHLTELQCLGEKECPVEQGCWWGEKLWFFSFTQVSVGLFMCWLATVNICYSNHNHTSNLTWEIQIRNFHREVICIPHAIKWECLDLHLLRPIRCPQKELLPDLSFFFFRKIKSYWFAEKLIFTPSDFQSGLFF